MSVGRVHVTSVWYFTIEWLSLPAWLAILGGSGPFPIAHRWRCGHRLDCRQLKDIGETFPGNGPRELYGRISSDIPKTQLVIKG